MVCRICSSNDTVLELSVTKRIMGQTIFKVFKCNRCRGWFVGNNISEQAWRTFVLQNKVSIGTTRTDSNSRIKNVYPVYLAHMEKVIPLESVSTLLDIGCYTGGFMDVLSKKYPLILFKGIEPNKRFYDIALEKRFDVDNKFFDTWSSTICYDIVVLNQVLEHVCYPATILTKAIDYLSDDGYMLITIPNVSSILDSISIPQHLSYFNQESIDALCDICGIDIIYDAVYLNSGRLLVCKKGV